MYSKVLSNVVLSKVLSNVSNLMVYSSDGGRCTHCAAMYKHSAVDAAHRGPSIVALAVAVSVPSHFKQARHE